MKRLIYKTTTFLNVDLDIHSRSDLQPLVTALGKRIFTCYCGRVRRHYEAHLELNKHPIRDADSAIRALAALIQALPGPERELWDRAKLREFNIGVQAAMQPFSYEISLAQ